VIDEASLIPPSGFLREWVTLYAPMGEAPDAAHLGTALALLSAAVGWRAWVRWGEMREPCTLMVVLEGQSAVARKTTTAAAAASVAQSACATLVEPSLAMRQMSHASDRGLLEQVGTTDKEAAARWEKEPPPSHLLVWDEFGSVLGQPGDIKGADWKGNLRAVLMMLYGGRHGGIQTGQTKILPSRCAVSLLGTMTRDELERRFSLGMVNDGFIGRMVMVPFGGRRAYLAMPPPWTRQDAEARDRLVGFIRDIVASPDGLGEVFGRFTEPALELRRQWYVQRTREFDAAAQSGMEGDVARVAAHGRLQATAVKLAAHAAIAERQRDDPINQVAIEERHVAWGIALAEYALAEVVALTREGAGTAEDRYARKVIEYLERCNGEGPVKRKQLMDEVRGDGLSAHRRWAVIETLHQESRVVIREVKTAGRPAMQVELLP
jgi:hypothetical protein